MPDPDKEPGVYVQSIVGFMTKEPLVQLTVGGASVQLSPAEARDVALNLLECAQASIMDLFLVEFALDRIGVDMDAAGQILNEFRQWRQGREKVPLPDLAKREGEA